MFLSSQSESHFYRNLTMLSFNFKLFFTSSDGHPFQFSLPRVQSRLLRGFSRKTHVVCFLQVTISKQAFGRKNHLSFSLSYAPNSKRLLKFLVKAEQENEPSSSSVAVVLEKPENEATRKGDVSAEGELSKESKSEAEEREKQQELEWKTDEESKKFMGNPSIEAAIKHEKKRADRKLKSLTERVVIIQSWSCLTDWFVTI